MSFALCCMLLGILVVCPETDGGQLTWNEPLPILTVQQIDVSTVVHRNRTRLIEDTINASLSWYFSLSSGLTFLGLNLKLETDTIAVVDNQRQEVSAGFKDKYGVNWISKQRINLVIFKVTSEHNATFACEVVASENGISTWRSEVQVDFVDVAPPSNIIMSSDQTITAPAKLTLNCLADGKPKPTIFWTRVSDNTNVSMPLNITGGKNEESYRCTADNGIGNPLTKVVKITILFPPKVILAHKVFVGREETASLNCEVEGNPTPSISWSPCEGNPLCNKQYLNISKVQSARANYMCVARNFLGMDSGTTVLVVGGKDIYLRLSVSGECDKKVSVWETLVKELDKVFANPTSYSGAQLIEVRCGSLIFDVRLKFRTDVAEDDTISIIQNAAANGKLGELSVNVSYIIGIPRFPLTTITAPTSITSKSDDQSSSNLIVTGVSIGVGVLISVVVGLVILWVLIRRNSRKENTKGDYEMNPNERTEEYEISPGRLVKAEDAPESSISRQPRSRDLFPGLGAGREKALGSAGHMIPEHPKILGVLNYHMLNGTFKMAVSSSKPKFLSVLRRIEFSLNNGNFPSLNLKPLQMKCFEYMLEGQDVIGVLPTGFGKSMLFHLLPHFIPVKTTRNIVIVVCPLNSIIEDQLKVLKARRITADVLQLAVNEKEPAENLFGNEQEPSEHVVSDSTEFPRDVVNGNTSIVFAHPEALLSKEGRELMGSKVFQDNVVACIVDEAHCVELWGEDFRKDFKDLSVLKAFFPSVPTMALTATAPPHLLRDLKQSLRLKNNCKIVARNPNRVNIYLDKKVRLSNHHGNESYDRTLKPIANELAIQRENYPMTIIYLKLKYCGYAYGLFERILKDKQCVGEKSEPTARLFAQFHSPQTSRMKKDIISEIKKEQSRVRVLFATSALGMGVDAPYVTKIIHITPPSSLEAYMQEIGRAGRTGLSSCATLYYNNSDVGNNKTHVEESMKLYCRSEDTCQRKLLLDYFGFSSVQQDKCCCICDGKFKTTEEDIAQAITSKVRILPNNNRAILERLIKSAISNYESQVTSEGSMLFDISVNKNLAANVMEGVEFIASEADLLKSFGIWDETCSSQIFSLISEHTAMCTTEMDSDDD